MTTEPDALGLFRVDPFCKKFNIELLENSEEKQSFVQDTWNQLSDSERAEDAKVRFSLHQSCIIAEVDEFLMSVQSMFVGSEILANHVDVAVVSPNSNLARIVMTRAGPRRSSDGSIRSVDIYWHVSTEVVLSLKTQTLELTGLLRHFALFVNSLFTTLLSSAQRLGEDVMEHGVDVGLAVRARRKRVSPL